MSTKSTHQHQTRNRKTNDDAEMIIKWNEECIGDAFYFLTLKIKIFFNVQTTNMNEPTERKEKPIKEQK